MGRKCGDFLFFYNDLDIPKRLEKRLIKLREERGRLRRTFNLLPIKRLKRHTIDELTSKWWVERVTICGRYAVLVEVEVKKEVEPGLVETVLRSTAKDVSAQVLYVDVPSSDLYYTYTGLLLAIFSDRRAIEVFLRRVMEGLNLNDKTLRREVQLIDEKYF